MAMLPPLSDPRVLVGTGTADDAGVYLLEKDRALVMSTDVFTPIVDDARDFGRIAAANAMSDIYAMGARPLAALNIMCFPDGELPFELMAEIILGGRETLLEAGAVPMGGHTVSDRELKYGLAVIGEVDPKSIMRNDAARVGDALVLTKPIGTGVLTTALKNGALDDEGLRRVTDVMMILNRDAAEAMLEVGADAATDITGFGLGGHAAEMAEGSRVTIEIDVEKVPLIQGALDAASDGHVPGGLYTNQHYVRRRAALVSRADGHTLSLIYDPQTSGGLLIAMAPKVVEAFDRIMREHGHTAQRVIGRVIDAEEKPLRLV